MTISSKRAEYLSRASLALAILCFAATLLLGLWSGFFAVLAVSWVVLAAVLIWFMLCVQFHQQTLAEQEKLDASELARSKEGATIFEAGGERAAMFAVAQRRLATFEKWILPIFSGLIAIYQLAMGIFLLRELYLGVDAGPREPLFVAVILTAIAFVCFLISRYAIGMASQRQWKPLRAGGSYLLGIAVLCFALAIALALAQFQVTIVKDIVNWVIPILLVFLGIEASLNVVMDIYRPRLKEQYQRSAFDSRLLGLIGEPGGIFRTAASTIDYQFGFKVSETWFYQLLERWILPLVLFSAAILYLLSCIVTVGPDEEAIIERLGNPITASNEKRIVGPGLTWKWPWPIDIAYKYPTQRISQINVGFEAEEESDEHGHGHGPLLWGQAHYEEEHSLLVASESISGDVNDASVPVSMVVAEVPVQYRVKDLYAFFYNYGQTEEIVGRQRRHVYQSERLLESICYRELTEFAASAKIEGETEEDLRRSLLGGGRAKAKEVLTARIQDKADEADLGVEIVFVGLQGLHPPTEVAAAYQEVVGAEQQKQAAILAAEAEHIGKLSVLAGSVRQAEELYDLVARYQRAKDTGDTEEINMLSGQLDAAFAAAKGGIFQKLREANGYAFESVTLAKAKGERFAGQLDAYEAAPQFYTNLLRLQVYEQGPKNARKYVLVAEPNEMDIVLDLQDALPNELLNALGNE